MAPDDGTKRRSGGMRAGEKRRRLKAEREAAAKLAPLSLDTTARLEALDESIAALRKTLREAQTDATMVPSQRREQEIRAAAALGRLADPEKIIDELRAEYAELAAALERLRGHHAPQELPRSAGEPPSGAAQH